MKEYFVNAEWQFADGKRVQCPQFSIWANNLDNAKTRASKIVDPRPENRNVRDVVSIKVEETGVTEKDIEL